MSQDFLSKLLLTASTSPNAEMRTEALSQLKGIKAADEQGMFMVLMALLKSFNFHEHIVAYSYLMHEFFPARLPFEMIIQTLENSYSFWVMAEQGSSRQTSQRKNMEELGAFLLEKEIPWAPKQNLIARLLDKKNYVFLRLILNSIPKNTLISNRLKMVVKLEHIVQLIGKIEDEDQLDLISTLSYIVKTDLQPLLFEPILKYLYCASQKIQLKIVTRFIFALQNQLSMTLVCRIFTNVVQLSRNYLNAEHIHEQVTEYILRSVSLAFNKIAHYLISADDLNQKMLVEQFLRPESIIEVIFPLIVAMGICKDQGQMLGRTVTDVISSYSRSTTEKNIQQVLAVLNQREWSQDQFLCVLGGLPKSILELLDYHRKLQEIVAQNRYSPHAFRFVLKYIQINYILDETMFNALKSYAAKIINIAKQSTNKTVIQGVATVIMIFCKLSKYPRFQERNNVVTAIEFIVFYACQRGIYLNQFQRETLFEACETLIENCPNSKIFLGQKLIETYLYQFSKSNPSASSKQFQDELLRLLLSCIDIEICRNQKSLYSLLSLISLRPPSSIIMDRIYAIAKKLALSITDIDQRVIDFSQLSNYLNPLFNPQLLLWMEDYASHLFSEDKVMELEAVMEMRLQTENQQQQNSNTVMIKKQQINKWENNFTEDICFFLVMTIGSNSIELVEKVCVWGSRFLELLDRILGNNRRNAFYNTDILEERWKFQRKIECLHEAVYIHHWKRYLFSSESEMANGCLRLAAQKVKEAMELDITSLIERISLNQTQAIKWGESYSDIVGRSVVKQVINQSLKNFQLQWKKLND